MPRKMVGDTDLMRSSNVPKERSVFRAKETVTHPGPRAEIAM
eukprot:gene12693-biopygen9736